MTHDDAVGRSRLNPGTLDQTDRILVAVCAALWLAALGAGVAAIVALVDLGTNHTATSAASDTPWLLYTVIGVSAAVIVGAVPLLIRARRSSLGGNQRPVARAAATARSGFGDPVEATTRLRTVGGPVIRRQSVPPASSRLGFPTAAVDQIWLRSSVVTAGAIGAATTLVGVGTYLMATESDTAGWIAFGLAGLVTVAMPAVPVFFLRQLRDVLA
ncbi:MAG: hypothetical protein QOG79_5402 [Mycobacterium sp.]|jgi:hypothetical protein|nr:hypothetical protein [Mycobacterium sp.]MDT5241314.1 hypothetical protein [Mycobacterium sp.]MDT5292632.1 hypothetical protein [Mycobacterium sp.]MDT5302160.1 hypothetical protein [Mycobacterium sp.]